MSNVTDLPEVDAAYAVFVTARYQDLLNELADAVGVEVERIFRELDNLDRSGIPVFEQLATPTVRAGQAEAIDLASAWLSETSGQTPTPFDFTTLNPVGWDEPFLRYWHELKVGQQWELARDSGGKHANVLGSDTARSAAHERMSKSGLKVTGYRRVPNVRACPWCQTVSVQRYHTMQAAAKVSHHDCKCAIVTVYGKRDPGQTLGRERLKELKQSGTLAKVNEASARAKERKRM